MVETPTFFDGMTGRENLVRALAFAGGEDSQSVSQSLERVGLEERADEKVNTYSLGMRQRLGIARALLGSPTLLILDEPTNGLDPRGMKEVRDLLAGLARDEDLTILISSHLLSEVEQLCNRIGILDHGRLVAEGTQAELQERLRGDSQEVEVGGPDLDAIAKSVQSIAEAAISESAHVGRLRVVLKGMDISELNARLVGDGVSVDALVPVGSSLEDSFLQLTGDSL
jgi:ABC-2 type transport system ATP-binding protein